MSEHHVLQPGDIAIGTRGDCMETLLGSCVAVVLSDPRCTVGAMCHIVHAGEPGLRGQFDTAYAGNALQALCTGLRRLGITPQLCEARVYGGGNMFLAVFSSTHVGMTNVDRVLDWLAEAGIPVLSNSVGGTCYRKLSWVVGPSEPDCLLVDVLPTCP
jgi:chemotaxis protein CheD